MRLETYNCNAFLLLYKFLFLKRFRLYPFDLNSLILFFFPGFSKISMATAVFPDQTVPLNSRDSQAEMRTKSGSENILKFICEFRPGTSPLQILADKDMGINRNYDSVSVMLPAQCSICQLRLRICMKVYARCNCFLKLSK